MATDVLTPHTTYALERMSQGERKKNWRKRVREGEFETKQD